MSSMLMVNQFQVVEKFLYSLKISENMAFSGGYRNETFGWNGSITVDKCSH